MASPQGNLKADPNVSTKPEPQPEPQLSSLDERRETVWSEAGAMLARRREDPWSSDIANAGYGLAKSLFALAMETRDTGDTEGAIDLLVKSLEINPESGEIRDELERLQTQIYDVDITRKCFIFPDEARATAFYGEAFQRAVDFIHFNGVDGDLYEFGVLAGWTTRLFAERLRDIRNPASLYLFDSFAGLPRSKWEVDEKSFDVQRGVWAEEMELPEELRETLGKPIEEHVCDRLATIIPRERIHMRKGFFSESLKEKLPTKAAIVHLDCDLYQSTVECFDALVRDDVLQDGTILLFDDWNCNRGNPLFGQRRSFDEFLAKNADRFSASHFFNYGHNCSAWILHDMTLGADLKT